MRELLARWLNHYRRGREYAIIQNLIIVSIFIEQFIAKKIVNKFNVFG
jgi:hypothetical protein